MTRNKVHEELCLISQVEADEECKGGNWIQAMKDELDLIVKNETWELVSRPKDNNIIGSKWVFKNKLDENGEITRNKARLVCKGYSQEVGVDYGEKFSLVTRMEGLRTLLVYASYKGFIVY